MATKTYREMCRKELDALKIPYKYPVAKTGIVGVLGTGKAPKYALRADIDALPIKVNSRLY